MSPRRRRRFFEAFVVFVLVIVLVETSPNGLGRAMLEGLGALVVVASYLRARVVLERELRRSRG